MIWGGQYLFRGQLAIFGGLEFPGTTPSNGPSNGFARLKIIKYRLHIKQVHW